jgi:hypothetical protein
MKKYIALVAAILLVGCQSFYSSVVTVTEIRKSVMNQYGTLYRAGHISVETRDKVRIADARYLQAADTMRLALIAYQAGTSTNDPAAVLEQVKEPVYAIVNIITPLIGEVVARQYNKDLTKANQL